MQPPEVTMLEFLFTSLCHSALLCGSVPGYLNMVALVSHSMDGLQHVTQLLPSVEHMPLDVVVLLISVELFPKREF